MASKQKIAVAAALATSITLSGCGGSDQANNGGGIGGTGDRISGVITAFGSVYVNGVKYDTDSASFNINGRETTEDDLRIGMVVDLEGTNYGDGTGIATTVRFDGELEAPVSMRAKLDANDKNVLLLEVFGIEAALNVRSTHFENTNFASIRDDVTELPLGQMVELSGYYDAQGVLQVTYFEKEDDLFISNDTEIELLGSVSNLSDASFDLMVSSNKKITIDISNSELDGELTEGAQVKVEGTANSVESDTLNASEIEVKSFDKDNEVEIQGVIQNLNPDNKTFMMNGMKVDASDAELDHGVLADNNRVEVEGYIVNNILVAEEVEFLDDDESFDYEFRAQVETTDVLENTITFNLAGQDVIVLIDNRTVWNDDQDDKNNERRIHLASIIPGDTLELDLQNKDNGWYATKVERIDSEIGFYAETQFESSDVNEVNETVNIFGADVPVASYADISDGLTVEQFIRLAHSFEEVELTGTNGTDVIDKISVED